MRPNLGGSEAACALSVALAAPVAEAQNRAVCLANSGTRLGPHEVEFSIRHCKRRQCYVNKRQISAFYH